GPVESASHHHMFHPLFDYCMIARDSLPLELQDAQRADGIDLSVAIEVELDLGAAQRAAVQALVKIGAGVERSRRNRDRGGRRVNQLKRPQRARAAKL